MSQILSQILLYLTDFGKFMQKVAGDFGAAGDSSGWLVILFFIFVVFLVGFTLGRTRMLLALVSIYAAAFIENRFTYFDAVRGYFNPPAGGVPEYWVHIGLFIALYVIVFNILNRSILKHRLAVKEASVLAISLEAILIVGLLASIIVAYLPTDQLKFLPADLLKYFSTKNAQFIWAILPLVAALFLRGKRDI